MMAGVGMRKLAVLHLALLLTGCELEEVSLTEPRSVLVAEVYARLGEGRAELTGFLQWTQGSLGPSDLGDAEIDVTGPGNLAIPLFPTASSACLATDLSGEVEGACFRASPLEEGVLRPGDRIEVEIRTADGGILEGGAVLPGAFALIRPDVDTPCALPPGVPLELLWTRSDGAWAYIGEAVLSGLRESMASRGVELDQDSVTLVGLSLSESDTTLVFPMEFGVFERFDLDRELALALQEGLPTGVDAEVVISALERNYVNWVRGGNFNPSGPVRVPSLRGDGTGVLGGAVRKVIRVIGGPPEPGLPGCTPGAGGYSVPGP